MQTVRSTAIAAFALALALPATALAYNEQDAVRDCQNRIKSEYGVNDFRNGQAQKIMDSEHHYQVQGFVKVDGDKHPWNCEIKKRHVVAAEYSGPKPKGMGTAEKLAVGAAVAIGAGVAASQASKHGGSQGSSSAGAAALQDLVGARAAGAENEMISRGYTLASSSKGGGASYTNWRKGGKCVTVRTANGRYDSIVDVTPLDCK